MKILIEAKTSDEAYLILREVVEKHGYRLGTNTSTPVKENPKTYEINFKALKKEEKS